MPSPTDFPTSGKILSVKDGSVVFAPRGTTYEMLLKADGEIPSINFPVESLIRVNARKVWTVPSGGNFLVPIMGSPRIIQGRVRYLDEKQLVVQAGANVIVSLPANDNAIDLPIGAISVGVMVNVTAFPGATIEFVAERQTVAASPDVRTMGAGFGDAQP